MEPIKLPGPVEWSIVVAIIFYLARSIYQLVQDRGNSGRAQRSSDRADTCSAQVLGILNVQTQILTAQSRILDSISAEQQRQGRALSAIAATQGAREPD